MVVEYETAAAWRKRQGWPMPPPLQDVLYSSLSGGTISVASIIADLAKAGYVIVPREALPQMFMVAGNVPISNVKEGRKGRIGDQAANDCWRIMVEQWEQLHLEKPKPRH